MTESLRVSITLKAPPERVYRAWLSSQEHAAFTGGEAKIVPRTGGKFTAWDGYISGKTVELEPFKRIVQSWRTTEFPEGSPDSRLEILLEGLKAGTKVTLVQSEIPDGQGKQYKKGWHDFYFKPMKEYFASLPASAQDRPRRKPARAKSR